MIRIQDLQEAIAECEGVRNPNANTCLKLASLYTILDHKQEAQQPPLQLPSYSYASASDSIQYESETDFGRIVAGKDIFDVMEVMDELMTTLQGMMPRLYDGVMAKLDK